MVTYVITVIGDDRVGLMQSLAEAVSRTGGNWERSEMTELAGKFAGILMVTVPDERAEELADSIRQLDDSLEVHIQQANVDDDGGEPQTVLVSLDLVGNDRPGIVQEITSALRGHHVTVDRFESHVTDAPMYGGQLFECRAALRGPQESMSAVQADLERIATELMVDLTIAPTG